MSEKRMEWLTTNEAASYLRVHPETLRNWARKGELPAAKLGNRGGFRFRREDLDSFLEKRAHLDFG
jgi:nitrogen PTS system EIIA component